MIQIFSIKKEELENKCRTLKPLVERIVSNKESKGKGKIKNIKRNNINIKEIELKIIQMPRKWDELNKSELPIALTERSAPTKMMCMF